MLLVRKPSSRTRLPREEVAKRHETRTTGKPQFLPEFVDHCDCKIRGMRAEIDRDPTVREAPPQDVDAVPLDYPILDAIARLAEKCAEFLEVVQAGRFHPTDLLPPPDARRSFVVQLGTLESDQRFRDVEVAERYARLWCDRAGQGGVNVQIVRVVKTVEAHYRADEMGETILANHPDRSDWLREAATEILGRAI